MKNNNQEIIEAEYKICKKPVPSFIWEHIENELLHNRENFGYSDSGPITLEILRNPLHSSIKVKKYNITLLRPLNIEEGINIKEAYYYIAGSIILPEAPVGSLWKTLIDLIKENENQIQWEELPFEFDRDLADEYYIVQNLSYNPNSTVVRELLKD